MNLDDCNGYSSHKNTINVERLIILKMMTILMKIVRNVANIIHKDISRMI